MKIIDPSYTILRPCALDAGAGHFAAAVFANALALFAVVYGVIRAAAWWLILPWLAMCIVHISCATYPPHEGSDLHADK